MSATPLWRIYGLFAFGYVLSYALRVINAVIGAPLMSELGLSNADLGLISAAYFIAFAAMQLPLGVWLDRYGARRTEAALLLVAGAGCALFALATSFWGLWLARALIGAGVSACLMAALKGFRQWLPAAQQSALGSAMFVAGTVGALSATIPVNAALPHMGWRGIFWLVAALLWLAAALLFFGLRARAQMDEGGPTRADAQAGPASAGYRQIYADPYFRRLCWIGFVHQAFFLSLHSLWGGVWLRQVLLLNKAASANVLFVFNLCLLGGYITLSLLAPRLIVLDGVAPRPDQSRRWPLTRVVSIGLSVSLLLQTLIATSTAAWAWILWPLLALFGTTSSLVQSHIGLTFPSHLAGRVNTAYNLLLFVGAFAAQSGMGLLIDFIARHGLGSIDTATAMRLALGASVLVQALVLVYFARNRAHCSMG